MEIKPEQVDAVLTVALANYDFVLLDMSRTLDTLAIKVLDRAHRIFPVLQATLPALRHARQLLGVFRSLGYAPDKFEWLVNRFEKGGEIGLSDIQQSLGVSSLRTVPNAYREVNAAINQGNPLLQTTRASSVTKTLAELAVSLNPAVEDHRSVLGRWFRRA
jgi:pilus assembly protein CpaE